MCVLRVVGGLGPHKARLLEWWASADADQVPNIHLRAMHSAAHRRLHMQHAHAFAACSLPLAFVNNICPSPLMCLGHSLMVGFQARDLAWLADGLDSLPKRVLKLERYAQRKAGKKRKEKEADLKRESKKRARIARRNDNKA